MDAQARIAGLKPRVGEIAIRLRELIQEAAPGLQETVKWGMPTYMKNGNICAIDAYSQHVNLQFYKGTNLKDPDKLLEGTGKDLRHVKIRSVEYLEAKRNGMVTLVKEAAGL